MLEGYQGGEEEKKKGRLGLYKKNGNFCQCKAVCKMHTHYVLGAKVLGGSPCTQNLAMTRRKTGGKSKRGGKRRKENRGKEGKMVGTASNTRLALEGMPMMHAI